MSESNPLQPPERHRGRYRIGAVAHATGLTTHTIRVWERRYQAVHPERTPGGDRLYSDVDIARLQVLKRLQQAGHGIGTIASLPDAELEGILITHHGATPPPQEQSVPVQALRSSFLEAVTRLDLPAADRALGAATGTLPARALVYDFLAPVLREIGARWEAGTLNIAHEHAASAALREHIAVVMRVYGGAQSERRVVITTPAGELHEFGALLTALLAAVSGWQVSYLGPNLPAEEIARAALATHAQLVLLSWVCAAPGPTLQELERLRADLPERVRILVGGGALPAVPSLPAGVTALGELDRLEGLLRG
ncbi:MAG TPA: MerR family transcriptional regulator [bacterium]|nr:MerR family transcriptional regulator [bacterium]